MKTSSLFPAISILGLFSAVLILVPSIDGAQGSAATEPAGPATTRAEKPRKGSATSAVVELKFEDFFASPVGPRGLEFTDKMRSLDGKRVRIVGYMVRQEKPAPGVFILTLVPVQTDEDHYGAADDLPPATLYVVIPGHTNEVVRHQEGLLRLSGVLSLGAHEEADGRMSTARLSLDPSHWGRGIRTKSNSIKGAQQLMK